jgi:hypothetical protein
MSTSRRITSEKLSPGRHMAAIWSTRCASTQVTRSPISVCSRSKPTELIGSVSGTASRAAAVTHEARARLELLVEPQEADGHRRQHFYAPDGTVLELSGLTRRF